MTIKVTDDQGTVLTTTAQSVTVEAGSPTAPPPPPPSSTLTGVEIRGPSVVDELTHTQYKAWGIYSDGTTSQFDAAVDPIAWGAAHAPMSADGVYSPPDVNMDRGDTLTLIYDDGTTQLAAQLGVTVKDAGSPSPPPPTPPPPTPPPGPTPPPPTSGVLVRDDATAVSTPNDLKLSYFWYCQGVGNCPGGETAKADGGVTIEPEPVIRIHQEPSGQIDYRGTTWIAAHGLISSGTKLVWTWARKRFAQNWNASVRTSYKYHAISYDTGGQQRLQKCCSGPGTQMSHGFGGGTPAPGTPALRSGSIPGDWISSGVWVDEYGWALVEPGASGENITSGYLLREVGGSGRHTFHGGQVLDVPVPRTSRNVHFAMNVNAPPLQPTWIDFQFLEIVVGELDPYGLLSDVR